MRESCSHGCTDGNGYPLSEIPLRRLLFMHNHTHDHGTGLSQEALATLQRGLTELLRMTEGMVFRPVASERYPLPLALAVYGEVPDPERVRSEVRAGIESEPLRVLEASLALLELYACNQPGVCAAVPDDDAFLTEVFASKRRNGWIVLLGDANQVETQTAVNARWQFKFLEAGETVYQPLRLAECVGALRLRIRTDTARRHPSARTLHRRHYLGIGRGARKTE